VVYESLNYGTNFEGPMVNEGTLSGIDRFAQGNGLRYLSRVERLLMCCGLLLLFLYVANRTYSAIYSRSSVESFWVSQASAQTVATGQPQPQSGLPDFRLWSEKRIKQYQASLLENVPPPLAVLEIPSLQLQVPVLEGTDDLTLDRAVGHISGTASPGESGNIGIAGHRDGFFRVLKDIQVGDAIQLQSKRGTSHYLVDEIQIVPPDNISVLEPRTRPSLTLVTCYPFYFVGSAPSRYIVHATATETKNLKSPEQPGKAIAKGDE
jgi:sortase A